MIRALTPFVNGTCVFANMSTGRMATPTITRVFQQYISDTRPPEPMMKFDGTGQAPILKYNVPEPNSYDGDNIVLVQMEDNVKFKPEFLKPPAAATPLTAIDIDAGFKLGFSQQPFLAQAIKAGMVRKGPDDKLAISSKNTTFNAQAISDLISKDCIPVVVPSMAGTPVLHFVQQPKIATPRIVIAEKYRLTSFRGDYGAGRVLKTFSLLPGEKTTISVSSYKKSQKDTQTASSILDSYNETSANEFEDSVTDESSLKKEKSSQKHMYADAEASASWGWGDASVKGGVSKDTSSSRESFARNVATATTKHANNASSQRNVEVNTSQDVKQEEGEETSTVRIIENINRARTLNFVFRQMNQEYFSVLHLIDIKVGFFNGFSETKIVVPLSGLDTLLEQVCADESSIKNARSALLKILQTYKDSNDKARQVIQKVKIPSLTNVAQPQATEELITEIGADEYLRFRRDMRDEYTDPTTQTVLPKVEGMIVNVTRSVLRTEGILVDALLGQGNALDRYSEDLQSVTIQQKIEETNLLKAESEKIALGIALVRENKTAESELYKKVFSDKPLAPALNVAVNSNDNKPNNP